jgi:hypothetical protein
MSTSNNEETPHHYLRCCWPPEFAKRRHFDKSVENEPYVEFLKANFFDGYEDEDDGVNENVGVREESEEDVNDDEDDDDDDDDVDGSSVDSSSKDEEDVKWSQNNGKDTETFNRCNSIKGFMEGMTGDKDTLQYGEDQVRKVVMFWKRANTWPESKNTSKKKYVASLDDRNNRNIKVQRSKKGECRPDPGPMTLAKLREELSKPVSHPSNTFSNLWRNSQTAQRFRVTSGQNGPGNVFDDGEIDAERRLM